MNPCLEDFLEGVVSQVSVLGILGVEAGIRSHLGERVPGCETFEKTLPWVSLAGQLLVGGEAKG